MFWTVEQVPFMTCDVFTKGQKVDVTVLTHQPTVLTSETVLFSPELIEPSVPRETKDLTVLVFLLVLTVDTC